MKKESISKSPMRFLGVNIEKTLWDKLTLHAIANDDTMSKLVRKILKDYVSNP